LDILKNKISKTFYSINFKYTQEKKTLDVTDYFTGRNFVRITIAPVMLQDDVIIGCLFYGNGD